MTKDANADSRIDLRRADWRFLLPAPADGSYQHLVLLGSHPELAERLRDAGVARRVSNELPEDEPVDVVAILQGAAMPATVRRAIDVLTPGGSLYCEIDRRSINRLMMTPGRMRRLLQAHSLSLTGLYWPVPGFAAGKRYVPLDVNGPLEWYFSTLYVDGGPFYRLVERVVRTATNYRGAWFAPFVPWYAFTASAGTITPASVLGQSDCADERRRSAARPFLITMGIDEGSRVALVPFTDGALPEVVYKVARLPEVNANIECEQERLAELRGRLDGSMRCTVPRPLGRFSYGDLAVGVESCAPGSSLLVSSGRWRLSYAEKVHDVRLATDWLGAFHQQVRMGPSEQGTADFSARMEHVLACYADTFGLEPSEARLFARVRKHVRSLNGMPLPIVWQHGDFGPWNVYRRGNEVTVIDWEVRQGPILDPDGPPLCDLLYFVTYWSFVARRLYGEAAERQGFRELFLEPDRTDVIIRAIWDSVEAYLARLSVDRRFVSPLLVYTWVKRALEELSRHRILDQFSAARRPGNQFVDWIGMLAAQSDQLFPGEHSHDAAATERDSSFRRAVS